MPDLFPADTDENASLADKEERPRPALGVWSRRLLNVPHLAAFLNASIRYRPRLPSPRHISDITALTDWGRAGASVDLRSRPPDGAGVWVRKSVSMPVGTLNQAI